MASGPAAWAWPNSESSRPASIRDSSRTRASWSRRITLVLVIEPSLDLVTTRWLSANAATWGRGVTTMTWARRASRGGRVAPHEARGQPGQPGEAAADLDRGLAADARVHLVEDERRDRVRAGEDHLDREHHPGQLAAGGALVQREGRGAGIAGEPQLDVVAAVGSRLGQRG